jgi:hypothetical protein
MFTSPLRAPAGEGVPDDIDVNEIDLGSLDLSPPAPPAADEPGAAAPFIPLSVPLLKLQMQDTTRTLLSQARQAAHMRCRALESRALTNDVTDLSDAVGSRLSVVREVLAQVSDPVDDAPSVRDALRQCRTAQRLMDVAEQVLGGNASRITEAVRRHCLAGASYTRLAPVLDPDFLQRVIRCDLLSPAAVGPLLLQDIHHPYRDFQPRFSCWKDAPVPPALDDSAVHARGLSTEQISSVWERLDLHGVINPMSAARMLLVDRDSDPADVDAVVAEWLTVRAAALQAVFCAGADVVVLRSGSAAARQVFGARPPHLQARYGPGARKLFIGVQATADQREVPAARLPPGRPGVSHFWLEHARLVMRDVWNEPAETPIPALRRIKGDQGDNPEFRLGWDTGVLDLPDGSFLQALAAAADDEPLPFPMGPSEEATQATVVAGYLLGLPLPRALQKYVTRRMADEGLLPTTAV